MSAKLVLFSSSIFLPVVAVILAAMPPTARGATAGELLEKAIYAEETVGDLDEAVKLYEQVLAEARTANSQAATAQYRLGLIYEKQGKADLAATAFRSVVENYPDEKELVAQARKRLPSELELLPVPWGDGDKLQLNITLATGVPVGTMIYSVESAKVDGKDVWKCITRGLITANDANSISWVACDKDTFAPVESFWMHSLLGEAKANYGEGAVKVEIKGKDEPLSLKTSSPVFDNEQAVQLFRRLPLKVGYKTELNIVSSLGAGEIKLSVEVPKTETIETPAGKFECYRLVLNIGQTFWISSDEHRYVVRFAAGGVTADLARIEKPSADATAVRQSGYTLQLPAGWNYYAEGATGDKKREITYLLDPNAIVDATVAVGARDSLTEIERVSAKAWSEAALKEMKKVAKDFAPREPSVEEREIGGQTAVTIVADLTQNDKKMTMYGVAIMSDERALNLRFKVPADKFDELKPQFEGIVNSLKVE